ncbi:MAG: hypothetical protein ACM37W_02680 [Actinomycetota bacterium]
MSLAHPVCDEQYHFITDPSLPEAVYLESLLTTLVKKDETTRTIPNSIGGSNPLPI